MFGCMTTLVASGKLGVPSCVSAVYIVSLVGRALCNTCSGEGGRARRGGRDNGTAGGGRSGSVRRGGAGAVAMVERGRDVDSWRASG